MQALQLHDQSSCNCSQSHSTIHHATHNTHGHWHDSEWDGRIRKAKLLAFSFDQIFCLQGV